MRVFRFSSRWEQQARLGARCGAMDGEVRPQLDLLAFRERHGLVAAARRGGVSIRTLCRWRAAYGRIGTTGLRPTLSAVAPDTETGVAEGGGR